jgi:murein L,D-transpeptidase YafK
VLIRLLFCIFLIGSGLLYFIARIRADWPEGAQERITLARQRSAAEIESMFAEAGVSYPPAAIYLRAFKLEDLLELWARGPNIPCFTQVKVFSILKKSGEPGPKRRAGDRQVPEGFYTVNRFNPLSKYHLSLGINYPNKSDRIRATNAEHPGSDIFIHGKQTTIGCLPIGDERIELLYIIADDSRKKNNHPIRVDIYPSRMTGPSWKEIREKYRDHHSFWEELRPALEYFEKHRRLPKVEIADDGAYCLQPG